MSVRTPFAALSAVAVAGLLAACGVGGSTASSAPGSGTKAGNCDVDSQVASGKALSGTPSGTITFQTTALKADFAPYFEKVISDFEKKYPGTKVNWQDDPGDSTFTQRMVGDAQACTLPDVVNLNQITAYALQKSNFLVDLDKSAPGAGDEFIPSLWSSLKMPGSDGHFVMPWYWGLTGLQSYNADLMKKAGLDPAQPPQSVFDQFADAMTIAKASGGQYYAFSANPAFRLPSDWQLMKVKITSDDQKTFTFANDPKAVEWVQKMAQLYQAGALPKDSLASSDDPVKLYTEGQLVWGSTNASSLRTVQSGNPAVYASTDVSQLLDARGQAMEDGQLIGVTSTSKNPVTALAFAKYLLSPDVQTAFIDDPRIQNFPSTTASLKSDKYTKISGDDAYAQAAKLSAQLAQNAQNAFIYSWNDAVNTVVVQQVQLAMQGKKTAQQALQDAQQQANAIVAKSS